MMRDNENKIRIILVGGGKLAGLIYSVFKDRYDFIGYVDDVFRCAYVESTYGLNNLGTSDDLPQLAESGAQAVVAIMDVAARRKYGDLLKKAGFTLASLIAETAIVSADAILGQGCIIRHNAVVSPQVRLGDNTVVSDGVYVGHDSIIGENVYIAPGVNINGSVTINKNTFVGTGAVILPHVKVGEDCIIGASSCVHKDVPDGTTVSGVPAKSMASRRRAPEVSVIMAAYNHEKYVAHSIKSVLSQTYKDFEFIIIDDGSNDGTAQEIARFDDPRIKATFSAHNAGMIFTKNKGIDLAEGRYIAIINSDDAYMPDKLQKQVDFLNSHPGYGAVFTDAQIIDDDGLAFTDKNHFYFSIFTQPNRSRYEWLRRFFYEGNCICLPSVMIRRECYDVVGRPDSRLHQLPDLDLWVRLCFKYDIHIMEEKLTQFRVRDNEANASGNRQESRQRTVWEYRKILNHYLGIHDENELLRIFPEAAEFTGPYSLTNDLIPYVLARLALKRNTPLLNSFAMDVLFDLLGDPGRAERIHTRFGFGYKDFIELTGSSTTLMAESTYNTKDLHTGAGLSQNLFIRTIGTMKRAMNERLSVYFKNRRLPS
jgi:sugar O-acyltransferase (sialic acid O-acetyltransferase NeuD family)